MQKKIIALAIAAALTAPALAMADAPTVYGEANISYDRKSTGGTGTAAVTNNTLNSNESFLGVKGSEALGNGMTGVYQIEGTIGMNGSTNGGNLPINGTTTFTANPGFALDRDTFIGVAGGFGTVVAGQHDTPYKIADRGLDVFAGTAADNRTLMGNISSGLGLTHDARVQNAVAYISPAMSGLTIAAATVFGASSAKTSTQNKGSAVSLAALYSAGPIFADFAYQSLTLGDIGTGDLGALVAALAQAKSTGTKAGVSFNGGAFVANLAVEKASVTLFGGTASTNTNMYLSGKFNLSAEGAVKAAYTKQGDMSNQGAVKTGATEIAVGYDHALSKTTTVYALYAKTTPSASGAAAPSVLSAGYKHSF